MMAMGPHSFHFSIKCHLALERAGERAWTLKSLRSRLLKVKAQ